ncbi:hypothetical protein BX661DRAFT_187544 [Kickxella alabastrina]|uniref:uncharacterized protein n=1 Tax=Kickxella alabastrina TaxID=61397 RepID=UPI00221FF065|nr:uncharacterized protein BX661DRAFT_187544 [Kickxella alabastrina]KAI7822236.1 hypothetical protein BX661DRAFT_187544 [Kickxella alabastrina]
MGTSIFSVGAVVTSVTAGGNAPTSSCALTATVAKSATAEKHNKRWIFIRMSPASLYCCCLFIVFCRCGPNSAKKFALDFEKTV